MFQNNSAYMVTCPNELHVGSERGALLRLIDVSLQVAKRLVEPIGYLF